MKKRVISRSNPPTIIAIKQSREIIFVIKCVGFSSSSILPKVFFL